MSETGLECPKNVFNKTPFATLYIFILLSGHPTANRKASGLNDNV